MSDLFVEILIIFLEIFYCKIFYQIFGKLRFNGWINIIHMLLLVCSVLVGARILPESFIIKQTVMVSIFALFMYWHLEIDLKKSFILALLYQAIILSIDYLTDFVCIEFCLINETQGRKYNLQTVLIVLLGKTITYFCIILIEKKLGKKAMNIFIDLDWIKLLFFPIFSFFLIAAMISTVRNAETPKQFMLLLISSIGMNIMVYYLINDMIDRKTQMHEDRIFRFQANKQAEMFRSISENLEKQKKITHEYRNQISCIEALVKRGQFTKLEEYIEGIYNKLDRERDSIDTNNIIVNAILNEKYQEANRNGIVFVLRINDLSELGIEDEDIVTILSNLLNNAIEACKKCIMNKRVLKLKFVKEDEMIKIGIRNTFEHSILYEDGEIKSTKSVRPEEHGVGITNIIKVIEMYNGSYVIKDEDQMFSFSIVIPDQ